MCDYSLEHMHSRPAAVGDRLVSTVFMNTITRGLCEAGGDPNVAVCLLPGTELAFDNDVTVDHALGFFPAKNLGEKTAIFREINQDPNNHHDALEFPSGRFVLLTRLVSGQVATVIQMPRVEHHEAAPTQEAQPVGNELETVI